MRNCACEMGTKGLLFILSRLPRRPLLEGTQVNGIRRRKRRARFFALAAAPLDLLLPALFFALGGLTGAVFSRRCIGRIEEELGTYISLFLTLLPQREVTFDLLWRTASVYLRGAAAVFLCAFAAWGAAAVAAVCLTQGFLFSFSLCSFAAVLGREGFGVLLALFLPRLCAVLPCTLLLAEASLRRVRVPHAQRESGAALWLRFGLCCVFLLLACFAELRLLPRVLSALT